MVDWRCFFSAQLSSATITTINYPAFQPDQDIINFLYFRRQYWTASWYIGFYLSSYAKMFENYLLLRTKLRRHEGVSIGLYGLFILLGFMERLGLTVPVIVILIKIMSYADATVSWSLRLYNFLANLRPWIGSFFHQDMITTALNESVLEIPGEYALSTTVPLCSAYSRFDFSQLFRPFHGRRGRKFSEVYRWHSYDLSCSNCRAIKEFGLGNGPVAEERAGIYMRESDSYKDGNGMRVFTSQLYLWGLDPCIVHPLLDPYPLSQPEPLDILLRTRIVGANFNVALLKLWLNCCRVHHGPRCHPSPTRKFVPFRLIDVQERRVIKSSEGLQ